MVQKRLAVLRALLTIILIASLILFWTFVSNLNAQYSLKDNGYSSKDIIPVTSQWQYRWGDSPADVNGHFLWLSDSIESEEWTSFHFPGRPENPQGYNTIWIRAILPESEIEYDSLRFRSPQQTSQVFIDGKLSYSFGTFNPDEKVRIPGTGWHFVQLPSNFSSKAVYFRLQTPLPQYTGFLLNIFIGNYSDHFLDIISTNLLNVIFSSFFIIFGIAILIIGVLGSRRFHSTIYIALISLSFGGWSISEGSHLLQLLFNIGISSIYCAIFFLFTIPIWFLLYTKRTYTIEPGVHSFLFYLQLILHILLPIATFSLDILGVVSCIYFNKVFHVITVISAGLVSYTVIRNWRNDIKGTILFVSGIFVFCITGVVDTFSMFYNTSPLLQVTELSSLGMFYFLLTLILAMARELKNLYILLRENLKENETNYKSLFENMTDGFTYNKIKTDEKGQVIHCTILESNNKFIEQMGLKEKNVIGTDMFASLPELEALRMTLHKTYDETAASYELTIPDTPIKLRDKWYKLSAFSPKKDYLSMIFSDITAIKNAEETIRRQAFTDSMTGTFNRNYFETVMSRMNNMLDELAPLSIIVIDVDGLKLINDTFGHSTGDALLIESAKILASVCKSNCIISRIGGDEFCIILPNTDYTRAQEKAEQIIKRIDKVSRANTLVPFSISVGVAALNDEDENDIYNVYRRADDIMYRYKVSQSGSEKSNIVEMLLAALSERDYVSQGHVERIVELSLLMSEALGLHDMQKRNLLLLAKVHVIGKIGIPDTILNKPAKLTKAEYNKMKEHVHIGYNIASRSKELSAVAPLILHHHEHWNGQGYPNSLEGEAIPLECRILAIIDAFDAMTSDRPYHKGVSTQEALEEIKSCAGGQFDPVLADVFINIIKSYKHTLN